MDAGDMTNFVGNVVEIIKILFIIAGAIGAVVAIIAAYFWFDGERCSRGGP